jgi:ring-1,2-phenylacetyl-CoA epoxidase subunit PaaB
MPERKKGKKKKSLHKFFLPAGAPAAASLRRTLVRYDTHQQSHTMNIQLRKFHYGDIPEENAGGGNAVPAAQNQPEAGTWPLWEVFIRSKQGLDHKHAGSLHAADAAMAIENARDVYTRRQEGVSLWVVESKYIHASNPDEAESLYEPAADKIYRHPSFYDLPDEVKHM